MRYRTYLRWDLPVSSTEGAWRFVGIQEAASHEDAASSRVHGLGNPHEHESILIVGDNTARAFRIERPNPQAFRLRELA